MIAAYQITEASAYRRTPLTRSLAIAGWTRSLTATLCLMLVASFSCAQVAETDSAVDAATMSNNNVPWTAGSLIGLSQAIPLDGANTPTHVAQLWQQFAALQSLHYAVNWSEPVDVYALYTGFDPDAAVIGLTIGYLDSALLRPSHNERWVQQLIPQGDYVNFASEALNDSREAQEQPSQTSIRRGWQGLESQRLPTAILERYHLNAEGTIAKGEAYILYR